MRVLSRVLVTRNTAVELETVECVELNIQFQCAIECYISPPTGRNCGFMYVELLRLKIALGV